MVQETKTGPAVEQSPPAATDAAKAAADARVAELEAENAKLREQLAAAGQHAEAAGLVAEPSFRFTEDNAHELRTTGRTVSPFTSKRYVGTDIDDAREATPEEFKAAKPAERPKKTAPRATGRRGK